METRWRFYFGAVSLLLILFSSIVTDAATRTANSLSENFFLNGSWKYNAGESDFALEKAKKFFAPARNTKKDTEIKALAVYLLPPEFVEFEGEKDEKVITEFFKDIEQTRIIVTDGNIRSFRQNSGFVFDVTASESENSLIIRTKSKSGVQFSETYQILEKEQKLKVVVKLTDSNEKELAKLQRIYQRTTQTQSINLSQMPF